LKCLSELLIKSVELIDINFLKGVLAAELVDFMAVEKRVIEV
jgi:hypothetical protein